MRNLSFRQSHRRRTKQLLGRAICLVAICAPLAVPATAAVIANDGGITLWVSYDNTDTTDASLDDTIVETNSPGGASCSGTNGARSSQGAPNSPPSCPTTGTCTARDKITGDLEKLADYIYAATEGAHYLRRVYVSDQGRAWNSADIKWNTATGVSSASMAGWANADRQLNMWSASRTCIHDVVHHELGHYAYNLPDRYARSGDYYKGRVDGGTVFDVDVTEGDPNTVMTGNFPHLFVDTTNARIVLSYDLPDGTSVTNEVLTPDLLADSDPANDGPDRAHHGVSMPFAQDEWSILPTRHVDLTGIHTEGSFPNVGATPAVEIVFVGDDEPHPGTVLLLDRSGSMSVTTNGVAAAQFVQEAGMFLYHSSEDGDKVGTYRYNQNVDELFEYGPYDPANDLPFASFASATGATDIAKALETAIDEFIDTHGEEGASGAEIYLMSDGKQTIGGSLWDQVSRANERGIRIHTLSFGDADATTMDGIASGTSGSNTTMSEREDAEELKIVMTRKLSTGRGLTPIHVFKGPMRRRTKVGNTEQFQGQFSVPPKTRGLKFYAFLKAGDASQSLRLQLTDPAGNTTASPPPDSVAKKGRFNGMTVPRPRPGVWTFAVLGQPDNPLPNEDVELTAYADNRELKAQVWLADLIRSQSVTLRAQLYFRYPMSAIKVIAHVYAKGRRIGVVPLADDGSTGGDEQAGDGVYSGQLALGPNRPDWLVAAMDDGTDSFRIEAEFNVTSESTPAPNAHYETGVTIEQVIADFNRGNQGEFTAWATEMLKLRKSDRTSRGKPQLRLDKPGSTSVSPGGSGTIRFFIENARPSPEILRVAVGRGIDVEIETAPDAAERKGLQQTYLAQVAVAPDAEPGARDLAVQFGDQVLVATDALIVAEVEDTSPDQGRRWLLWIVGVVLIAVFIIFWLRRRAA